MEIRQNRWYRWYSSSKIKGFGATTSKERGGIEVVSGGIGVVLRWFQWYQRTLDRDDLPCGHLFDTPTPYRGACAERIYQVCFWAHIIFKNASRCRLQKKNSPALENTT